MKKELIFVRLLFLLFVLSITTDLIAQSASKKINEIKRNESYLFEEATANEEKEAREMAVVKLSKVLSDYMKENHPESAVKINDYKDLAVGADEIVGNRGSKKRVFLYFKKSDLDEISKEATDAKPSSAEDVKADTSPKEEAIVENVQVKNNKPADEPKKVQETRRSQLSDASQKNVSHDFTLDEWQKKLLFSFLKEDLTLIAAKDLVNTYRVENKVKRYGTASNSPVHPEKAFYVIADESGKVIAVLGRDDGGQRMNYISGKPENLSDYSANKYIWFTLNN